MSKNFVELKKASLLVWNLIVIICRIFEDGNTVELLTGASLDRGSKEKLGLICVCLKSIMGKQTSGPNTLRYYFVFTSFIVNFLFACFIITKYIINIQWLMSRKKEMINT